MPYIAFLSFTGALNYCTSPDAGGHAPLQCAGRVRRRGGARAHERVRATGFLLSIVSQSRKHNAYN